jgi:O-acetyl-ADP-ribose deacetylase
MVLYITLKPWLREETAKFVGGVPGQCVFTKAVKLPASYIVHTVGLVWKNRTEGEEDIRRNCYKNALDLAKE